MASGRGQRKVVKSRVLNDAKETENKKNDALNALKSINQKVLEKSKAVQKSLRSSKTSSNIANVDSSFAKDKSVNKITEFFKSDEGNDNMKETVQSKENVDNLVTSNSNVLLKSVGKTKSNKRKVQETEVFSDNKNLGNSEQAVKAPAKRGRKKATVETKTNVNRNLEESKKTSQNVIEEKKIFTSRREKIKKAKGEEVNKNLSSESLESTNSESSIQSKKENIEVNKKLKNKRYLGRKRKDIEHEYSLELEKNESDSFSFLMHREMPKVVLKRNVYIEELYRKLVKEDNELAKTVGGAKKSKAGKRAKPDDKDTEGSGEKPAKVPKKESNGQSKKDKMPDVTLLDFSNDSTTSDGKNWNLKLSSWNVNGIRAWLEKDGLNFLQHEAPDVICFQETKCSDKQLPEAVNVDGYHSFWLAGDKDGYSGVGLLSKTEPLSVKYGIDVEDHDKEGRVITAEYENFYLVTAYVPNAGRGLVRLEYRIKWDEDFRLYLKKLDEKKPVILCGDLNVAHEEIDLANPKANKKNAGFTKEEREGFSTLLSEGFIDSFRYLYPDEKAAYTFWTYMMNARAKNVGWRLDYFVISKRFVDHLCDNVIRKNVYGSDHCPITLFLAV